MHYSRENLLLKVAILVLALCYSSSGSSLVLLANAYIINDGPKIASTGRAFEYESFPTYNTDHSAKGFGVPRAVSHSAPEDDGKQALIIGSEIIKPQTLISKGSSLVQT